MIKDSMALDWDAAPRTCVAASWLEPAPDAGADADEGDANDTRRGDTDGEK
jgi:hypothetical protein